MSGRRVPLGGALLAAVHAALLTTLLVGCGATGDAPSPLPGAPVQPDGGAGTDGPTPEPPDATPTPAPTPSASTLRGLWGAGDDDGAQIVYEFDGDGTFTRISLLSQERSVGTFRFQDVVEGTFRVDGDTLDLRPTQGAQTVDDPDADSDGPVSTATTDLPRERHGVELRDGGAVLVLDPPDGEPVTLLRQQS